MNNFDKLFIHLFTKGIEHYRDSLGTLKEIDDVLNTHEDILYEELKKAFNQANRLNLLKKHGIPFNAENIGDSINTSKIPKDLLNRILNDCVSVSQLKDVMENYISKRK